MAFCTIELVGPRVVGLLDGREGADVDFEGLKGPNKDSFSPTVGYRAVDSAGVVVCEAKSGVCCAAMGVLYERGGKDAVVDGLMGQGGISSSLLLTGLALQPSTTVAS